MTNITLITGEPKSGKSTFLSNKYKELHNTYKVGGVIASDIRDDNGDRTGFVMKDVATNETVMLADLACGGGKVNLGKWYVYVDNIENFMIPAIANALETCDVIFIDEVASMQLLSEGFKSFILSDKLVTNNKTIFITIAKIIYDDHENDVDKYIRNIADNVVLL